MKLIPFLLVLMFFAGLNAADAQAPDWLWANTNSGSGMAVNAAGNVYVTGSFSGILTLPDTILQSINGSVYILKYDPQGNILMIAQAGGSGSVSAGPIAIDRSGNIVMTGSFTSSVTFGTTTLPLTGLQDFFVVKFDSSGNAIWAHSASSTSALPAGICIDTSGNIGIAGSYITPLNFGSISLTGAFSSSHNVFIVKYSPSGSVLWAHTTSGVADDDYGNGITSDPAGNFFITGYYEGSMSFGGGVSINDPNLNNAFYIAKYNSAGAIQWAKTYGGTTGSDYGYAIAADASGNVYATGLFNTSLLTVGSFVLNNAGDADAFLIKFDNGGTPLWAKSLGGYDDEGGVAIETDPAGNVYLSGYFETDSVTIGTTTLYGGNGTSGSNFFVAKYNSGGAVVWAKDPTLAFAGSAYPAAQGVDNCGNVYVCGSFSHPIAFAPLPLINVSGGAFFVKLGNTTSAATNATCYGGSNGSATVNAVNNDVGPFTYAWSNGDTTATATGLAAGVYSVTVTDARGCADEEMVTIADQSHIQSSFSFSGISCSGTTCTGMATAHPTGGATPYTYLWSPSAGLQTTVTANGLCIATYSVTITDSLGCVAAFPVNVVPGPGIPGGGAEVGIFTNVSASTLDPAFSTYYAYDVPSVISANPANPNNFVNPGSLVRLKMKCMDAKSNGAAIPSGQCIVRTNSPYITVTDSIASFNPIPWNLAVWANDEIEISINALATLGANAYVDLVMVDSGIEYANTCIAIPIYPLVPAYQNDTTITDDNSGNSHGNGDHICEEGETIEFKPLLNSITNLPAYFVRSSLENLDSLPYINIWNNHSGVHGNVYDTTWWNYTTSPQPVSPGRPYITPKSDFVFDYTDTAVVSDFYLYNVISAGFRIFPSVANRSLFRWSVPFDFNSTRLGITKPVQDADISIYPNPSQGEMVIAVPKSGNYSVAITDIAGHTIMSNGYTGGIINLHLDVASGVYFATMVNENTRERVVKKIIIAK